MHDSDHLTPWCRAVIRDGRVTLNGWTPTLFTGGPALPALSGLARSGTVLADLRTHVSGDREELIVEWVPSGSGTLDAEVALLEWAAQVGYVRVWLPDEVVDVDDDSFEGGVAEVECPGCGLQWSDSSPDFWAMVRAQGCFPGYCMACNSSLPEWDLAGPRHGVSDPSEAVRH